MGKIRMVLSEKEHNIIKSSYNDVMGDKLIKFYDYLIHITENNNIKLPIGEIANNWNTESRKKWLPKTCVNSSTIYRWCKKLNEIGLLELKKEPHNRYNYKILYINLIRH